VRILLTGKNGQVGWELARTLAFLGEVVSFDRAGLDLAAPDRIASAVRIVKPEVVINAAAYTAVDQAENEPDRAHAINATAVGILAEEARRAGALFIHYSTDYVFDGDKAAPYVEEDEPHPLNAYGRSKLAGELAIRNVDGPHLILRTSWVYAARGRNFLLTVRRLLREKTELRVVSDQIGAPTSASMLADVTAELLRRHGATSLGDARGLYHATASGFTSWYGFATEIARLERPDAPVRIVPVASSEYPSAARRPANSRLSTEKLSRRFGVVFPSWEACLQACHATLREKESNAGE
jgi:dTDP-4-dehydrorhamnose reductase